MSRIYEVQLKCGCLFGEIDKIHQPCDSGYWDMTPDDFRGDKPSNYDLHISENERYRKEKQMKFQVLENGKPCDYNGFTQLKSLETSGWENSKFETYEQAVEYLDKWLGQFSPGIDVLKWRVSNGQEYDYSGYGDLVTIVEVNND